MAAKTKVPNPKRSPEEEKRVHDFYGPAILRLMFGFALIKQGFDIEQISVYVRPLENAPKWREHMIERFGPDNIDEWGRANPDLQQAWNDRRPR